MKVTIRDVAQRAGVSKSLVSKVVRREAYVSEAARTKVTQAMQELGYRPNLVARSLSERRTRSIGCIVSDVCNPYFPDIARGIEDTAWEHGHMVLLCNTDGRRDKELAYVESLIERGVDGIIFTSIRIDDTSILELDRRHIPYVLVSRVVPGILADVVLVDNRKGGRLVVDYLARLGHRRIAHIRGPLEASGAIERCEGYCAGLEAAGMALEAELVEQGNFKEDGGYVAARRLLALPSPPTAIFAGNDLTAIGALAAIEERGLVVPRDISLIGFDNIHVAELARINLTTVDQPRYEMGRIATDILWRSITGQRDRDRYQVVLEPRLIERGSAASPGAQAPRSLLASSIA